MDAMLCALKSVAAGGFAGAAVRAEARTGGSAAVSYVWAGAAVVELSGSVDRFGSAAMRRELRRLADRGARTLLVDLRGVRDADSSTLAELLDCLHRLWRRGGQMAVFGARPEVRAWFEVFRLDGILRLSATREEALAACARPARGIPQPQMNTDKHG